MDEMTMRADVALVSRGLAPSRTRARQLIESGLVDLNGAVLSVCEHAGVGVTCVVTVHVCASVCVDEQKGG